MSARSDLRDTCGVCFSPPGVECNRSVGWLGGVNAGPHARAAIADFCTVCRGTGQMVDVSKLHGFKQCADCKGTRRRAAG